jgi:hypothetical protein
VGPGADSRYGGLPEGRGKGALSGRAGLPFPLERQRPEVRPPACFLTLGHPVEREACEDESAWFAPFVEDADISVAHGGHA